MTEVISVKFKSRGKTYFFSPGGLTVPDGSQVVVETSKGLELADCVKGNHFVTDESIIPPLRPAVRLATADDMRIAELCRSREREAFKICEEKIAQRGLDMKLVDVECSFEGSKILFFFTSDGRVDFRELVKDLAGVFRTRIELRQIGVRDEAKMLGGLGICGRSFCCSQFLDEFLPVSTKMAKVQSLSLNPAKISGSCGRLMCCLRYEQEAYEDLVKTVPKNGAFVQTPDGYGNVTQIDLLRQTVKVRLDGSGPMEQKLYTAEQVAAIPGGRPRAGEPLPDVLKYVPPAKKSEPEKVKDEWADIVLLDEYQDEEKQKARRERLAAAEKAEQEARAKYEGQHRSGRSRRRGGRGGHGGGQKQGEEKPQQQRQGQNANKPRQQQSKKPQPKKPEGEKPQAKPAQENAEKKPNPNHRRRRRPSNKPKQSKPEE